MKSAKFILSVLCFVLVISGCNFWGKAVNTMVTKDLGVDEIDELEEKYVGRRAWTRALIIDLGEHGIIDRGVEVQLVEIDTHWGGAIGVRGPNNRKFRHALNLERPVTKDVFEQALERIFWFESPERRYRANLRLFGKRTARSIRDNEVFKGMKREAVIESWGHPDEIRPVDIGNVLTEQFIYRDPHQPTKRRYVIVVDGIVDSWEE